LKTLFKIVKWLFIGIFILIVLLLAFTQTALFRNKVRVLAEKEVSKQMNGTLTIGELEGSFFRSLSFKDVAIIQGNDTIVCFKELSARWRFSPLFRHKIRMEEIRLVHPQIYLVQLPDSTWNVNHLFPPSEEEPTEPGPFNWSVFFPKVELEDGDIFLETGDSTLPKKIGNIDLKIGGNYQWEELSINLEHLSLITSEPALEIRKIAFQLFLEGDFLSINEMVVKTAQNEVSAGSRLNLADRSGLELSLKTAPLIADEFSHWTGNLELAAQPELTLTAQTEKDVLQFDLKVETLKERHIATGELASWQRFVEGKPDSLRFSLLAELNRFDISTWLKDPGFQLQFTSKMELGGNGFDLQKGNFNARAAINQLVVAGRDLGGTNLAGTLSQGNLQLDLKTTGKFGRVSLQSEVDSVFSEPIVNGRSRFADLNLAPLLLNDSLYSNLNLSLEVEHFNPEKQTGSVRLTADSSSIKGIPVDSLRLVAETKPAFATVDTLMLALPGASLSARGTVGRDSVFQADWLVRIADPVKIPFVPEPGNFKANMDLMGVAEGKIDSIEVNANIRTRDLVYNEVQVNVFDGTVHVLFQPPGLTGESTMEIKQVQYGDLMMDSTKISAGFSDKGMTAQINLFVADTLESHLTTWALWSDPFKTGVPELQLTLNEVTWNGRLDSLKIEPTAYEISNFSLSTPADSNRVQLIALDGIYAMEGEEDILLRLERISVGTIMKMLGANQSLKGEINSHIQLKGSAIQPEMNGDLSIRKLEYDGYKLGDLSGSHHYEKNLFSFNFIWRPIEKNDLELEAALPFEFSPARQKYELLTDSLFSVSVKTIDFPLSNLAYPVRDQVKLSGLFQADLKIGNTIENPRLYGFVLIPQGNVEVPDYGIKYRDLFLQLSANGTSLALDSLKVQRDKGWLGANGAVQFGDSLLSGEIVSNQLSLKAKDFYIVKHRDYEMEIKGGIDFKSDSAAVFGGGIVVQRSKFNVPALLSAYKKRGGIPADAPLLVQALEKESDSPVDVSTDSIPGKGGGSNLMKNLRGRFTLEIPRNTWFTSPEGSVEISGKLDIVKEGDDFQVFGPLEVVRGHFDFYGRRFRVEEGKIDFVGNYNPNLDFNVEYVFRDPERKKQVMSIFVTGNVLSPVLEFKLDDEPVTEGDAISYIAFGKSLDNLSYSEQSSVNENVGPGALAGKLAANVVSKQLTNLLGNAFSLDLVELKAESNWRSAAFLVGKYLTNDLFISYQKNFGNLEDDDVTPEIITLEYELTKFLFLQLVESDSRESGIDLFFKFEKGKK